MQARSHYSSIVVTIEYRPQITHGKGTNAMLMTSDDIEKSFKVIRMMINGWSYRLMGLIWWIR